MRASKEYRRWINRVRKRGKKNGVIPAFILDAPHIIVKDANSKRDTRPCRGKLSTR